MFTGRTDVEAETPILWPSDTKSWLIWKDPDAEEDWGQGRERDDREWDGWMVSLTEWTWVWVDSRSWWWTGRPGMLQFMGLQRVGHNWATELDWCTHIHRLYSVTATCRLNVEYNPFSLVAQMLKNLPAMWETQVQSWGWEDSLEKGMATYSSILVWKIP